MRRAQLIGLAGIVVASGLWATPVAVKGLLANSNGSACTSQSYEPSHVLAAMGLDEDRCAGAVRVSWSHNPSQPDWEAVRSRIAPLG